jgi:hypothetical protein
VSIPSAVRTLPLAASRLQPAWRDAGRQLIGLLDDADAQPLTAFRPPTVGVIVLEEMLKLLFVFRRNRIPFFNCTFLLLSLPKTSARLSET